MTAKTEPQHPPTLAVIDDRRRQQTERPRTRGECPITRPCPWVSCRYHLYLDVNPHTGRLIISFPEQKPWELAETCALDVAERAARKGGFTLHEVSKQMNITRERVRQIEFRALERLGINARLAETNFGRNIATAPAIVRAAFAQQLRPARVRADWGLVEREARAISLAQIERLDSETLAQIAGWSRAVARARRNPAIELPPRPPILDKLLAEHQHAADHETVPHDDGEREANE